MPLPAIPPVGEPNTILGLPLCEFQAKRHIELASKAPYRREKNHCGHLSSLYMAETLCSGSLVNLI